MLDINFIRENAQIVKEAAKNKKINVDIDELLNVDQKRRDLIIQVEDLRKQRNEAAQKRDIEEGKSIKEKLDTLENALKAVEEDFQLLMVLVPNVPSIDTPIGQNDEDNVEFNKSGEISEFEFEPKDHIQIGKDLDILDLERGAKVGGYRGYYLKNEGAVLVMALMMYAVKKMVAKGYMPMIPPTLVKGFALFGSGYFKGLHYNPETDEIYQVATGDLEASGEKSKDQKFLVGTAEPSLLAYYSDEILDESQLPLRVCGYSQCYRSEIGSYGKDTKGMYRVHEFMKVEQVVLCRSDIDEAEKLQQEMVDISKEMHEDLGLAYRQIQICTGDMSAGKYKAFDIEAWLPGMKKYGETGSASNFTDWQSRRLNVKYKTKEGEKKYVYMLNNTALPSPRIFIALLENYQQKDGSVKIPKVLQEFTGFSEIHPK